MSMVEFDGGKRQKMKCVFWCCMCVLKCLEPKLCWFDQEKWRDFIEDRFVL